MRVSWVKGSGSEEGSEVSTSDGCTCAEWELYVELCWEVVEDTEDRSSVDRARSDSEPPFTFPLFEPQCILGTATYLLHSSLTPSSITNPPISAVGAYTALKLKMSRSTRLP